MSPPAGGGGGGGWGKERRPLKRLVKLLGPGLVTGAADDDPAGITTYSQAGAAFRYGLLWTALFQIPLMCAVQYTVGKIGQVSGRDLAQVLKRNYPVWVLWFVAVLLIIANTVTAAADIAGVAAGAELLTGVPSLFFVPLVAVGLSVLLVLVTYKTVARVLKWLALALIGYFVAGVLAHPQWGDVLRRAFVPGIRHTREYFVTFLGVFGTTISPSLFIWQSAEEVEEQKATGKKTLAQRRGATKRELADVRDDTISGMVMSQLIGFFIIVAAGATLYPAGTRDIESARQAAMALQPIGGGVGEVVFALGLIGTGLLAVPTLVGGSAYALGALGGWRTGIGESFRRARWFYVIIFVGMLLAAVLAMLHISPVALLFGSAVVNGILAPPLLVVVLLVANNRKIMEQHTNGWLTNVLCGVAIVIMGALELWLAASWVAARIG